MVLAYNYDHDLSGRLIYISLTLKYRRKKATVSQTKTLMLSLNRC